MSAASNSAPGCRGGARILSRARHATDNVSQPRVVLPRIYHIMSKYLAAILPLAFVAACGDNLSAPPDGALPPDAVSPDASACSAATDYPRAVQGISVDLTEPFELGLDGVGSRCEQVIRAVTDPDPAKRPPQLVDLDLTGIISTCTHNTDLDREVVRLRAPMYAGMPLFAPVQDVVLHVATHPTLLGMPALVVYLHGDFLPAPTAEVAQAACLDAAQLAASMPGRALPYARFDGCVYQGDGAYTIATDDVVETGQEGLLIDRDGNLRRVRPVDVYLAATHVSAQIGKSDLFCCNGTTLDHCAGERLYIDVVTGEVVSVEQHCHTC